MTLSRSFFMFCLALLTSIALSCVATSSQAAGGEHPDDAELTVRVQAAILREPTLRFSEITIASSRGVVQMDGVVASVMDRLTAVEATRKVSGVKGIRNELTVKTPL